MTSPISTNNAPKIEKALPINNASLPPTAVSVEIKTEQISQQTILKPVQTDPTHCWACHKKVGLLGFKCKCSYIFCSKHRYSEQHNCDFDYKKAYQEKIAKENPKIVPAKIVKI